MLYPSEAINILNISCEPSEIRNFCNGQFPKPTLNSCAQSMSLSSIYLLASITSLGGFTFGYDTGIMNGLLASPTFHSQMGITLENMSDRKGSIAAALQAGGLLGAVIQPLITDWLGRKVSILYMCVLFSIGVIFQTLATSLEMMLVGRFIAGIGVSIMAVAVSMYNTEMAPSAVRGRIVGMQQLMVGVGSASAYWINYFLRMVEGKV
jgi:MFS family permease